jgi:hypothetical protein
VLSGVDAKLSNVLERQLNISSVRELAEWPPFLAAKAMLRRVEEDRAVTVRPTRRRITGTVSRTTGEPFAGALVRAFSVTICAERELAAPTVTDADGEYVIVYEALEGTDVRTAAFARDANNAVELLGRSAMALDAGAEVGLDIVVGEGPRRELPEFDRVARDVGRVLQRECPNTPLSQLSAAQVELLIEKSAIEPAKVRALVYAMRLGSNDVPAAAFYALARKGLEFQPAGLAALSSSKLRETLVEAIDDNVAGESLRSSVDAIVEGLGARAVTGVLEGAAGTPAEKLPILLELAEVPSAARPSLLRAFMQHEGTARELWQRLRTDPNLALGGTTVDRLELTTALTGLVQGHLPLVKALRQRTGPLAIEKPEDLASLQRADFQALLELEIDGQAVGCPRGLTIDQYAGALDRVVELAFPTRAFAARLAPNGANGAGEFRAFLLQHQELELQRLPLRVFFAENPQVLANQPQGFRERALVWERAFRLAPKTERAKVAAELVAADVASAERIQKLGKTAFLRRFTPLVGARAAREVFGLATTGFAIMQHLALTWSPRQYALASITRAPELTPELVTWASAFGEGDFCSCEHCASALSPGAYLVDLLGWLRFRAAAPAGGDGAGPGEDASGVSYLELLTGTNDAPRRLDIPHIALSCKNTLTPLPYLDLVNEQLEYTAVSLLGADEMRAELPALDTYQTTGEPEELLAHPEHLLESAYRVLNDPAGVLPSRRDADDAPARRVCPFDLPFDLRLAEARAYLAELELSRAGLKLLMHEQTGPAVLEDAGVTTELLELSRVERGIIATANSTEDELLRLWAVQTDVPADWGRAAGLDDLLRIDTLLFHAGTPREPMSYAKLTDLLRTRFVAGPLTLRIEFEGESCDLADARLAWDPVDAGARNEVLDRLGRMIRLAQRMSWSVHELDQAISVLGAGQLNDAFLTRLAHAHHLSVKLALEPLEVLSFWGSLDTRQPDAMPVRVRRTLDGDPASDRVGFALVFDPSLRADGEALAAPPPEPKPSFYERVVGVTSTTRLSEDDPRRVLLLNAERSELAGAATTVEEHAALIASTLRLAPEELLELQARLVPAPVPLNLATLSALFRHASLARAHGLSIAELLLLLDLSGSGGAAFDAFSVDRSAALVDFGRTIAMFRQSDLSTAALDYLLRDRDVTGALAPDQATTAQLLVDLQDDLLRLADEAAVAAAAQNVRPDAAAPEGAETPTSPETLALRRESLVVQRLSDALGLEVRIAEALLTEHLAGTEPASRLIDLFLADAFLSFDAAPEHFAALRKLHKLALLLAPHELRPDELAFLFQRGSLHGLASLAELPAPPLSTGTFSLESLLRLVSALALRRRFKAGLFDLVESSHRREEGATDEPAHAELLAALAGRGGWPLAELEVLSVTPGFELPTDRAWALSHLARIGEVLAVAARTGVEARELHAWSLDSADGAPFQVEPSVIGRIIQAARRRHGASWPKRARGARDELREKQRDALVSALVGSGEFRDTAELFGHFLLDTEMSACQLSSRVQQAIGSVQLFVQRVFLDLEPRTRFLDGEAREWEWRKNYRVWEANRKVFLYPENWLEPEFRDDKTPFFVELESALMQNELTPESAEAALRDYLVKLDEVSNLEVRAMCIEGEENDPPLLMPVEADPTDSDAGIGRVMHVVARTRSLPHKYFYRERICRRWSPWERLEVGIEGEHLMLTVFQGNVHLLWPTFFEIAEEDASQLSYSGDGPLTGQAPKRLFKVGLDWTRRDGDGWLSKQSAAEQIEPSLSPATAGFKRLYFEKRGPAASTFYFFIETGADELKVGLFRRSDFEEEETWIPVPYMFVHLGSNVVVRDSDRFVESEAAVPGLGARSALRLRAPFLAGEGGLVLEHVASQRLLRAPEPYALVAPREDNALGLELLRTRGSSAFFQDSQRSYVVERDVRPALYGELANPPENAAELARLGDAVATSDDPLSDIVPTGARQYPASAMDSTAPALLRFQSNYHPFAAAFRSILDASGPEALFGVLPSRTLANLKRQESRLPFSQTFQARYRVSGGVPGLSPLELPREDIDFSRRGAYGIYNWEVFFHIPLLIAERFRSARQFAEARRWYHFIFDPTAAPEGDGSSSARPRRYWRLRPFYDLWYGDNPEALPIRELLAVVGHPASDSETREELNEQISEWLSIPFQPHAVARVRLPAYQKFVFLRYCDNLIEWADLLFRQDTRESLNEASQLYLLAAELLGRRPEQIPVTPERAVTAESILNASDGNALEPSEGFELCGVDLEQAAQAALLSFSPEFCVPVNQRLLDNYWDRVADRLFKLRHCMDIEGRIRQLPLFEPPIDPAALIRARQAGVDIQEVLQDLNLPPPHYRYSILIQRALDLCAEVRSLGGALLAAMEKRDAERLSVIRAGHDVQLLDRRQAVCELQLREATEGLEGVKRSLQSAFERAKHYFDLLHADDDAELSEDDLLEETPAKLFEVGGEPVRNADEKNALGKTNEALLTNLFGQGVRTLNSVLAALPDFDIGVNGVGGSPKVSAKWGSSNLVAAGTATASVFDGMAIFLQGEAEMSSINAQHRRRQEDWRLQGLLAARDYQSTKRQIAAAELRIEIAKNEQETAALQLEQAEEIKAFLDTQKFTGEQLYRYQVDQLTTLYFQTHQLAYGLAKQAEAAWKRELGIHDVGFIKFGYWDRARAGLLAGERLFHDLKRMETAYYEQRVRELELVRHVSLRLLNPMALLELRETGHCEFTLPEALFDLDGPGHYYRRIQQLSVSIPSVAGPFVPVRATLRLLESSIRIDPSLPAGGTYARTSDDDARFMEGRSSADTVVTSRAQDDAGLFDTSASDGRYLPFEGAGAISSWSLDLPRDVRLFDYGTISDVILHLRLTAREGGETLRAAAVAELRESIRQPDDERLRIGHGDGTFGGLSGLYQAISLREQFPAVWHRFLQERTEPVSELELSLTRGMFQYFAQAADELRFESLYLVAVAAGQRELPAVSGSVNGSPELQPLSASAEGMRYARLSTSNPLPSLTNGSVPLPLSVTVADGPREHLSDLVLVVGYSARAQ